MMPPKIGCVDGKPPAAPHHPPALASAQRLSYQPLAAGSAQRNTLPARGFQQCGEAMTREEERELTTELERLKQEHRDLDSAIDALFGTTGHDRIQLQRLKKRKLQLRDRISAIEDEIFPDIIA